MSMLKNPMIIMMGVTLVFTILVPKMMENIGTLYSSYNSSFILLHPLDPEALAEIQGKDKVDPAVEPPPKWTTPELTYR